MSIPTLFFYLFSIVIIASALMVISSRNPVHSVLFLILAFFNAAGLFVLLGAEFLAMILVVVYVGAVAVLFLFVVMMLDVDFAELKQGFLQISADRRAGRRDRAVRTHRSSSAAGASTPTAPANVATPMPVGMTNTDGARARALHAICLSVPGGGPRPADRDDRRDRPDAAPQGRRQAAGCRDAERANPGRRSRGCEAVREGVDRPRPRPCLAARET